MGVMGGKSEVPLYSIKVIMCHEHQCFPSHYELIVVLDKRYFFFLFLIELKPKIRVMCGPD